ncbi:MAG: winged helix-turn-helix domain-containing protein [Acidobacteriota bacterium]
MISKTVHGYEFNEFVLIPDEHLLMHLKNPVPILPKELAILTYLVGHCDAAVTVEDLTRMGWGDDAQLAAGNISHHMAKLRKLLGCDARNPKYIKTLPGNKGYRFIAAVNEKEIERNSIRFDKGGSMTRSGYKITAHLFVPMFLGESSYSVGPKKVTSWGEFAEVIFESGELFVNSSGFGVWHVSETKSFRHLYDVAAWRKQMYDEIIPGKHAISARTKGLIRHGKGDTPLKRFLGRPGYVFSTIFLHPSHLQRNDTQLHALKILSNISALEPSHTAVSTTEELERLERRILDEDFQTRGTQEFGVRGTETGFASWDGVSYIDWRASRTSVGFAIVDFEIAVQSLWWMCKCLIELKLSGDPLANETVRKYLPEVKRAFSAIKNIGATESASQRTMVEAVFETSRIRDMVEEVSDLFG